MEHEPLVSRGIYYVHGLMGSGAGLTDWRNTQSETRTKKNLIWIGALYFGSGLAPDPYSFSFFSFIGGLGVGATTVAGPMYISEISTPKNRGKLVALYQFNLVLGILLAFISNYLLKGFDGSNDWRWMLGIEGLPAAIYFGSVFFIPQSPRWLITERHDKAGAREVLEKMDVEDVELELQRIEEAETIEAGYLEN